DGSPEGLDQLLILAAVEGKGHAVEALVAAGASLEAQSPSLALWRPLHLAVEHGHAAVVRRLVELGADINARATDRMTPLHLAVDAAADAVEQGGPNGAQKDVLRTLVDLGADTCVRDSNGKTPSDWAKESGQKDLVSLLPP
ncbi:MAG: ankyrin repeat domain-containing protein, partial [Acidobacteriota bacterium]